MHLNGFISGEKSKVHALVTYWNPSINSCRIHIPLIGICLHLKQREKSPPWHTPWGLGNFFLLSIVGVNTPSHPSKLKLLLLKLDILCTSCHIPSLCEERSSEELLLILFYFETCSKERRKIPLSLVSLRLDHLVCLWKGFPLKIRALRMYQIIWVKLLGFVSYCQSKYFRGCLLEHVSKSQLLSFVITASQWDKKMSLFCAWGAQSQGKWGISPAVKWKLCGKRCGWSRVLRLDLMSQSSAVSTKTTFLLLLSAMITASEHLLLQIMSKLCTDLNLWQRYLGSILRYYSHHVQAQFLQGFECSTFFHDVNKH